MNDNINTRGRGCAILIILAVAVAGFSLSRGEAFFRNVLDAVATVAAIGIGMALVVLLPAVLMDNRGVEDEHRGLDY